MSALETARQYCQTESEAPSEVAGSDPAIEAWPSVGTISFREVCLPASVGEPYFCFHRPYSCAVIVCDALLPRALGCSAQSFVRD